jgi:Icc protein
VDGTTCCPYAGPDGAGHYVKVAHNGIEYVDIRRITAGAKRVRSHSRNRSTGHGSIGASPYGTGSTIMRIVQLSDIHVGSGLFKRDLLDAAVEETNELAPDLVAIAGDLTTEGYRHEFEEVGGYLAGLECPNLVVVMGNHDARNVGYRHFEDLFGARERAETIRVPEGEAKLVALDTTKPDLDEGEVGREHYAWIDAEFRSWNRGPRILVIHHHILAVPGTGRDRNSLRDAGDVMALLRELRVDLVLAGHRHVPYVWSIAGVRIIHSGTVSTLRLRGTMPPSYNLIELDSEQVRVTMRTPAQRERDEPLATFAREAVSTSQFYPAFERFVRFERLPFMDSPAAPGS